MIAKIKNYHSPDIDDLINHQPADPENFSFLLQLMIGPENEEGEESFDIEICTPKWLSTNFDKEEVIFGRHRMIVFEYNFDRIIRKITTYVRGCAGDNWNDIAQKIAMIGRWEFEDYKEYSGE